MINHTETRYGLLFPNGKWYGGYYKRFGARPKLYTRSGLKPAGHIVNHAEAIVEFEIKSTKSVTLEELGIS